MTFLAQASRSIIAWTATSSTKTSGTFVMTIPRSVAASRSMRSTPTPPFAITLQRSSLLRTSPFSHLPPAITASASRMLARYASSLETSAVSMVMPSGFSPSCSCGYDVSVALPNGVATTL